MNLGTQDTQDSVRVLLRRGAAAVAAARVAIGVTALVWPAGPARSWVGPAAGERSGELSGRVFGRALGGRDLALGLATLAALRQLGDEPGEPGPASVWVAAGALSDALDVVASLAAWRELPRLSRWLVLGSAAGASLTGAAGALALRSGAGSGPS
jgi:hypothetical protein